METSFHFKRLLFLDTDLQVTRSKGVSGGSGEKRDSVQLALSIINKTIKKLGV